MSQNNDLSSGLAGTASHTEPHLDFSFLDAPAEALPSSDATRPSAFLPSEASLPAATGGEPQLDFSFLQEDSQPDPAAIAAQSVNAAHRCSPQRIIEARRNAARLGVSFQEALTHNDVAGQLADQTAADELRRFSPRLVQALQGKTAYAAREDFPLFNNIAAGFADFDKIYGGREDGTSANLLESLSHIGADALHGLAYDLPQVLRKTGQALTHGAADFNTGMLAGPALALAENVFGPESAPARWARSALGWIERSRPPEVASDSALGQFAYDFVRSAPQQAGNVMAAMAGPAWALGVMGTQIAGQSYVDLRRQGVSPAGSLSPSLFNAAAQAPMERLALDKVLNIFKSTGIWETVKRTFGASATEGLTEYIQNAPDLLSSLWGQAEKHGATIGERIDWFRRTLTDIDTLRQAHSKAVYEGLIGASWGGLFGGVGVVRAARAGDASFASRALSPEIADFLSSEAAQAQAMTRRQALGQALENAAVNLDQAVTAQQGPQALAEMLDEILPEGYSRTWIGPDDAVTLFQEARQRGEAEAAAVLETLGTTPVALQQAAERGDPLPVSTAAVLTQLQGDTRARAMNSLRVTPDGVSGAEAAAYDPAARAEAAMRAAMDDDADMAGPSSTEGETLLRQARSARRIRAEVNREVARIAREMENSGYARHAARTFAQLHEQHALAFQAAYGVDPAVDILRRVNTSLGDSPAAVEINAAAQSLNQAAMYRHKAQSLQDFVQLAEQAESGKNQSYFSLGEVQRPEADGEIILTSDAVKHIRGGHSAFEQWAEIADVLRNGKAIPAGRNGALNADVHIFLQDQGENTAVVVAAQTDGKKTGRRVHVVTAFTDSTAGVRHWLAGNKKAASYQSAGGQNPADPSPISGDVTSALGSGLSEKKLTAEAGDVNAATLNQAALAVEVRGEELGVPDGADIREYIAAAKKYHDTLKYESEHGQPVMQPQLERPVRFSGKGWRKNTNAGADAKKWALFPHLRKIIENSTLIRTQIISQRHDAFSKSHWCEADVVLDGTPLRVGFTLLEDVNGNLFYNLNADTSATEQKAPSAYPASQSGGLKELHQDAITSVGNNISPDADNVNLRILPQEEGQGGPVVRGSVTLSPESAAVRIFKGANLSTIPHESAHIFLDDLMRVAADDGSIALGNMRRSLADALKGEAPAVRRTVDDLLADAAKFPAHKCIAPTVATREATDGDSNWLRGRTAKEADGYRAALRTAVAELRAHARDARAASRAHAAAVEDLQRQAEEKGETFQPGQTPPWFDLQAARILSRDQASAFARAANIASRAVGHLHALDQARADLRALRQWAGAPLEGELVQGSEEWKKFHETVARGFEQYLREGRAPSRKLEAAFARLRSWLLKVYEQARDILGLPVSDDVRRVFDRMLATDAQIRRTRGMRDVLAAESDFMGSGRLQYDEWDELNALRGLAEREVQAAMDRATLRERNKRYKEYYAEALAGLDASPFWQMVGDLSARTRSPDGQSLGGLDRAGVVRLIGEEQTAELSRARHGIINAQGNGSPVDMAALEQGYEDADALVHDLYDALVGRGESKKKLAVALAEQRLAEDDRAAEADALSHGGESYAAYLDKVDEVVLRIAARKGYRSVEEQDRFVRNSITPRSVVRNQAFQRLYNSPLRDITPERYQAMLDKALRDRSRALVDGDVMAAVRAVDNARVANELIWSSRDQLRRSDELLDLAAKTASAKPGTFPTIHREALRKLLDRYGLAHMRGLPDQTLGASSLRELVEKTLPGDDVAGILPSFADWLLNGVNPNTGEALQNGHQPWRDLTPAQLQEVENLLHYLRHVGYDARTDAGNSEAARVELTANQAAARMRPLKEMPNAPADSLRRKAQDAARGLYASIDALRWQFRKADGFSNVLGEGETGPMEVMLDQILGGEQRVRERVENVNKTMAPHLVHLADSVRQWEKRYGKNLMLKDVVGRPVELPSSLQRACGKKHWTADMALALALNCGNRSNMARLAGGYPDLNYETLVTLLGDRMAARIFNAARGQDAAPIRPRGDRPGLLSLDDWRAVQGVWDALATQWADTQAVHERMHGFKPQGVEPQPLVLTDQTGNAVTLSGGYYPVRYDPNVSDRVANWNEKEDLMARNEAMFAVPAARRGHAQARTERAPGLPLRLDTGIILEHINDVVRFIELGEIVRRADQVTRNPVFRAEYTRAYGRKDYDAIRPNLRGLVRQEPPPKSDWVVSVANAMRKYLVPWGLAWNLKVAALQMTAVFPAMGDLGARPVLRAMGHMSRHGLATMRRIWEASPYMKSRMDNIDQDLQRHMANFNPARRPKSVRIGKREIAWEDLVNAGMLPIVGVDMAATGAVWLAAYTQKLSQLQGGAANCGISTDSEFHQQAVDVADSMVKQSNPDYDPSSRSGFLRAQNGYRLFNAFAGAVTLFAARHKYMYTAHAKGKISLGRLARFEMYDTILPAAGMFLFLALVRGYAGDDDNEELAKLAMSSLCDFGSQRIPIFGNNVGDGVMSLMGMGEGSQKRGGVRTTLDTPVQLWSVATGRAGRALHKGVTSDEQARQLAYAAADIVGFLARVPVSKLARNAERGWDQWQRGKGTPLSVLMPRPGR